MSSTAPSPVDPKLAKLRAGEPLEFPPPPKDREETHEEKEARTIPAQWLADLAGEHKRVVSVPVTISGAIITGPLDLQYATFECELSITDCEFTDAVDFSFAAFQRSATFLRSCFKQAAHFRAAHVKADLMILGASFADDSSFQDLHVDETILASGATFGEVGFESINVGKDAFFRTDRDGNRTTFAGNANFHSAHIRGDAAYGGAEFKAMSYFDNLQVDGNAFFSTDDQGNRATFAGQARFPGAHIRGDAAYVGAEFKASVFFDGLRVDGSTFFRSDQEKNPVTFAGLASFTLAHFGVDTQFTRADFRAGSDFDDAHFRGAADFRSAEFASENQATFIGAHFEAGCHFSSTQFRGETDFTAAVAERDAQFSGSQFSGPTSFREARFHAVFFGEPLAAPKKLQWPPWKHEARVSNPTVFGGPVDLRGFTYERIYADLPGLFAKLTPFDRQPYSQLEASLRKVGDDKRAHQVYLERRRVERREKFRSGRIDLWLLDWLYKLVARYGVRPYQLPVYALLLILFGAYLFSQPGALEPKNPAVKLPASVGFWQGLAVSVHYFLPMDTPVGAELAPTATHITASIGKKRVTIWLSASWYATLFLRVAGTILVGVGVAAAAGLLRRIAP